MKQSTKFKKAVHNARKNAISIPDFFEEYTKILQDMYGVTMNITGVPADIVNQNSSHNSPIQKPQAWTEAQIDDPKIPNTYKAYKGQVTGTTNFNGKSSSQFEATRLFWSFGDICLEFFNGNPNRSYYKIEDGVEKFAFDIILFVEDFPLIYRKYRKQDNIDKLNENFNMALDDFVSSQAEKLRAVKLKSAALAELREKRKQLDKIQDQLSDLESKTNDFIENEEKKKGVCLPKIENQFLNQSRYNNICDHYNIYDISKPDETKITQAINRALEEFSAYRDEFIEDFL